MLTHLRAKNLLSFRDVELTLGPLNVLIGPNGSGKSNVLSALALAQAMATDLPGFLRHNGGTRDWIFKKKAPREASVVEYGMELRGGTRARHMLGFADEPALTIEYESIDSRPASPRSKRKPESLYTYLMGNKPLITKRGAARAHAIQVDPDASILSQRRDPEQYPVLTEVAERLQKIRFYRDWRFGRHAPMRQAQPADLPTEYLLEDGSNLGLILKRIQRSEARADLLWRLKDFYSDVIDVDVSIEGNSLQVFLQETSGIIPATRLSDGTLRWMCLLCVLLHPTPPPLLCIEEPELGLHPDLIPTLARLLQSASERTQLVVTTHSDALVDALTDTPEAIVVCEKVDGATECRRPSPRATPRGRTSASAAEVGSATRRGRIAEVSQKITSRPPAPSRAPAGGSHRGRRASAV